MLCLQSLLFWGWRNWGLLGSVVCQGIESYSDQIPPFFWLLKSFNLSTLPYQPYAMRKREGMVSCQNQNCFSQNWAKDSLLSKLRRSQRNCCSPELLLPSISECNKGLVPRVYTPWGAGPARPLSKLKWYFSDCYYVFNSAKTLLLSKLQHWH